MFNRDPAYRQIKRGEKKSGRPVIGSRYTGPGMRSGMPRASSPAAGRTSGT